MLEIREEIATTLFYAGVKEDTTETLVNIADEILSCKLGNHTLKELIEMIDKGELVKLAKDQDLPESILSTLGLRLVNATVKILQREGFRKVEPLKGEWNE